MKLEIPVEVDLNGIDGIVDEIKCLQKYKLSEGDDMDLVSLDDVAEILINHIEAKRKSEPQRWIPFETREPDAEEKEDHPEWEHVLCGNLPDDGQRILVNIKYKGHEAVQMDEYVVDSDVCYLDSGYDIGTEATAWMPLPEAYHE